MRRDRRQQAPRVLHHAPAPAGDFEMRPVEPLGVGHRPARMIALRQVHRRRVGRREGARKNTCDAQNLCRTSTLLDLTRVLILLE